MTIFYIHDERDVWHEHIAASAHKYGFNPQRVFTGHKDFEIGHWGFIRPHATPDRLLANIHDYGCMRNAGLKLVQDEHQVAFYDSKIRQLPLLRKWMPKTVLLLGEDEALAFLNSAGVDDLFPLVSKASEGASSMNVRFLNTRKDLAMHIEAVFKNGGLKVHHCDSKGTTSRQTGYLYLQEFVQHEFTYRVNIIGSGRVVFKRYNFPNRPAAQTGNVEGVYVHLPALLDFANKVASDIETEWCALDILECSPGDFVLLETSLAWPWPPEGKLKSLAKVPIHGTRFKWGQLFDCMFEEIVYGR